MKKCYKLLKKNDIRREINGFIDSFILQLNRILRKQTVIKVDGKGWTKKP